MQHTPDGKIAWVVLLFTLHIPTMGTNSRGNSFVIFSKTLFAPFHTSLLRPRLLCRLIRKPVEMLSAKRHKHKHIPLAVAKLYLLIPHQGSPLIQRFTAHIAKAITVAGNNGKCAVFGVKHDRRNAGSRYAVVVQ